MIFGIIPISINFESIINQIENEVTEMDDLIKGVKIGKILTKDDEKKETKKIVAIVLAVIAAEKDGEYSGVLSETSAL